MFTRIKWSIEDYHRMIAAGILADRRVELLSGDIVAMSPEGPLHASRIRKVANYLRKLFNGVALVSEAHPVTLSDSEPEPDIAIVRLPESQYDDRHPNVDDIYWLIEISDSTVTKDLEEKKKTYATASINEYWVINLDSNLLTVFQQPQENNYLFKQELKQGEIAPLTFPETSILVSKLLS